VTPHGCQAPVRALPASSDLCRTIGSNCRRPAQQLRGLDAAQRTDDFPADPVVRKLPAAAHGDADRPAALDQYADRQRVQQNGEVFPPGRRAQERARGADPPPVGDGAGRIADPFGVGSSLAAKLPLVRRLLLTFAGKTYVSDN